jgi:hypothetical protein
VLKLVIQNFFLGTFVVIELGSQIDAQRIIAQAHFDDRLAARLIAPWINEPVEGNGKVPLQQRFGQADVLVPCGISHKAP